MVKAASVFGLFSVAALTGAIACSTTTTVTEAPADAGTSDGAAKKDSGPIDDGDSGSATGDEACAQAGSRQACGTCCATNHETGYDAFVAALTACDCAGTGVGVDGGSDGGSDAGAEGACATECADTFCASTPKTATTACSTCIQESVSTGGACQEYVSDACKKEPDCLEEQKCILGCPK
jgi:hypothetical protein